MRVTLENDEDCKDFNNSLKQESTKKRFFRFLKSITNMKKNHEIKQIL